VENGPRERDLDPIPDKNGRARTQTSSVIPRGTFVLLGKFCHVEKILLITNLSLTGTKRYRYLPRTGAKLHRRSGVHSYKHSWGHS
jgi:hypothetical protein